MNRNDIHIVVAGPEESPPHLIQNRCGPISNSHTKVYHVYTQGLSYDGLPFQGEIAVCRGNGTDGYPEDHLYAVYFCRTSSKQVILEFFLSSSLAPDKPLPYAESDDLTAAAITMLKEDGDIETCIQKAHEEFYSESVETAPNGQDTIGK